MKKNILLFGALIGAFLLVSCSGGNKKQAASSVHAWQACAQRNLRFRFVHFCLKFIFSPRNLSKFVL